MDCEDIDMEMDISPMEWEETCTKQELLNRLFSSLDYAVSQGERPRFQDVLQFARRVWQLSEKDIFDKIVAKYYFLNCVYPDVQKINSLLLIKYKLFALARK